MGQARPPAIWEGVALESGLARMGRMGTSFPSSAPVVALVLLGTSCAITSAEFTSQVNQRETPFRRILVLGSYEDLIIRKRTEQYIVDLLVGCGVEAIPSMSVLMAGTEPTAVPAVVEQRGVDGVLIVGTSDTRIAESYVTMPSTTTTTATGQIGNDGQFRGAATSFSWGGGSRRVTRPHASYRMELFDQTTGMLAWTATAYVSGNGYPDWDDLRERAAREAIYDLRAKRLLPTAVDGKK